MEIGLLLPNWDGCPNSYSLRSVVGSGSYSEVVAAWRNDGVFEEAVAKVAKTSSIQTGWFGVL
jgi:nitroimidazol reductase NimA-like FMN-containing flavoprotein (pyridoxamine 5'-phosphate oxidase superfamily)